MKVCSLVPSALYFDLAEASGSKGVFEGARVTAIIIDIELDHTARLGEHCVKYALGEVEGHHAGRDGKEGVATGQEM